MKKDISDMEADLAKLEQTEQKYTAELKAQAAEFDPDEPAVAQLEIRPQEEASAESRVQAAYGDKYDFWTMIGAKLGKKKRRSGINSHSGRNKRIADGSSNMFIPPKKDKGSYLPLICLAF